MNKARKTHKGLPRRVYARGRTWYFFAAVPTRDPKDGKEKRWIPLAKFDQGESAMLQALAVLLSDRSVMEGTMPFLCSEFRAERIVRSRYSEETKKQYSSYLARVSDAFEEFHVVDVTTKDIAEFLRHCYGDSPNTGQKVAALLKRLFKYAIATRGLRQDNPVDQLEMEDYETQRRQILPTHEEIGKIREAGMRFTMKGKQVDTYSGPMFACMIDMAYLLWQRGVDMRTLKEAQFIEGEKIRFQPGKTKHSSGKVVDIVITPAIKEVIERAKAIKRERGVISPYVFPTRNRTPYTRFGLRSMWDRAKERAGVNSPITFRDIRALAATDAARRGEEKEAIRARLAHTTSKTSEIYIKEAVPEVSEMDHGLPWKTI